MANRVLPISFLLILLALSIGAAEPVLFPAPLHLTRTIEDSVSGTSAVIEQYCHGNRVVSVRGSSTLIADYGKGELTEIDRQRGTYSVSRFDEVAKARRTAPRAIASDAARGSEPRLRRVGVEKGGREAFEGEIGEGRIEVAVDRRHELSKAALEAIVGGAFPGQRSDESNATMAAARNGERYALPVEQVITYGAGDERVEQRSRITRVGNETAPAELIAVPKGARLVESRSVRLEQEHEALDRLPSLRH